MKTKGEQIDGLGGAIQKCMKTPTASGQAPGGEKCVLDGGYGVEASCAKTHWAAGKKGWRREDQDRRTKDLAFAVLLRSKKKEYHIRYFCQVIN
jgi:hypothetical protein